MPLYKPTGRKNYSYDFQLCGRRFSGSTGKGNRREAELVVAQIKKDARKQADQTAKFTAGGSMTLEIAASRYWLESGQHLANSQECYCYLGRLIVHLGKQIVLERITDSVVAELVAKRRGEGVPNRPGKTVANATVNRSVIEPLRAIMRRAAKVWKVPVADVDWGQHTLKETQERVREASRDEEQKLISAMRGDYVPALRFAILTGCRRMEQVDLTWACVDFFNRTFTVTGKGDKTRVLPMSDEVFNLIWAEKNNHPTAVFTYVARATRKHLGIVRGERRPITKEGYKTAWRRFGKKLSGVENFRYHDARHTAATRVLRAGNLKIVQQMLGHANIATTAKYAHSMVDDMRAAMNAVNTIPIHIPAKTA